MFKKIISFALLAMFVATPAFAEGTAPVTETWFGGQDIMKKTVTFTSDAAAATIPDAALSLIDGFVFLITINHDDVAPCDDTLDITVTDSDGVDVLGGAFLNLTASTADTYQAVPIVGSAYGGRYVGGAATMSFAQCGTNSKSGVVNIYFVR